MHCLFCNHGNRAEREQRLLQIATATGNDSSEPLLAAAADLAEALLGCGDSDRAKQIGATAQVERLANETSP